MEWFIGLAAVVLAAVVLIGLFHGPSHRADRRAKEPDPPVGTTTAAGAPDAAAGPVPPAAHLPTTPTAKPPLELPDAPGPAYVLPPAGRPRGLRGRPVKRPRGRQS